MPDASNYCKHRQLPAEFITGIMNGLYNPEVRASVNLDEVRDALSAGQLASKLWLVEELDNALNDNLNHHRLIIVGGWFGYLARLILTASNHRIWLEMVLTYDIEPRCKNVAYKTNYDFEPRFKGEVQDALTYDYTRWKGPLVVINTSCEHMPDVWAERVPEGSLIVAQSNNYRALPEHVNCVDNAEELAVKLGLKQVSYAGEMSYQKYTRFMVIGKR